MDIDQLSDENERSRISEDEDAMSTARTDVTEEGSEEGSVVGTPKSSSRHRRRRNKNGLNEVDTSPPDKKLARSEKKAKKFSSEKKFDEALQELIRCTALARIVYGDGHWKLAEAYANLARGYFELKDYPVQAQAHAETAKNVMYNTRHVAGSDDERANIIGVNIQIHYAMGLALIALQRLNEAEKCLMTAEKQSKDRAKLNVLDVADTDEMDIKICIGLAKVNAKQQKFANSIRFLEKAIDLIKLVHGDDSIDLIPVYQSIGQVEQAKGKLANQSRAVEMYYQAHVVASEHYKEGAVEVAETAMVLAAAYAQTGDPAGEASAESYMNEALITYQVAYGPNHAKTVEAEDELAKLMVRTDRQQEAISLLKKSIAAKKEVFGDNSQEVADTYKLVASVHLAQGDMELSLKFFQKCLSIETMLYGAGGKRTKNTQSSIDMIMANPRIASTQPRSKKEELKTRPRFSSIVNRSSSSGGFIA
ncbi:tetratricopeptide repeat protein 23-like [Lineus longissimus]|uniref:tetratricopeptide repeat protein 23-like n=1 Tax=Lineus longissimus TaxID=88925 RepID=UPI002B4E166B